MAGMRAATASIWDVALIQRALLDAAWKLNPLTMARNPVMFVVEVGAVLVSLRFVLDAAANRGDLLFEGQIVVWLWLTVLFANFAEAMAEGRGESPSGQSAARKDRHPRQQGDSRQHGRTGASDAAAAR